MKVISFFFQNTFFSLYTNKFLSEWVGFYAKQPIKGSFMAK